MTAPELPGAMVHGFVRSYRLVHPLAFPRLGTGWRALTAGVGGERLVAVRHLPAETGPDALSRLRDEIHALTHLRHHGVLKVEDVVEIGDRTAVVTEWAEGTPLPDLLSVGPVPPRAAIELGRDLAWVLHTAHVAIDPATQVAMNLAHRDVRPDLVWVSRPADVRLVDFGLSRLRRRGAAEPASPWSAPERAAGRDLPAADVYALAVLVLAAVLGRVPAPPPPGGHAAWVQELLTQSRLGPGATRALAAALLPDPDARIDAGGLARALRDEAALAEGPPLSAWLESALVELARRAPVMGPVAPFDAPDPSMVPAPPGLADVTPGRIPVKPVARALAALPPIPPPRTSEGNEPGPWDALDADPGERSRSPAVLWGVLAAGAAFVLVAGLLVGGVIASRVSQPEVVPPEDAALVSFTGPAGSFHVGGDPASDDWERRVRLVDEGGKAWSAGPLPAGTYMLDVTGIDLPETPVVVPPSQDLRVVCSEPLHRCWVQSEVKP